MGWINSVTDPVMGAVGLSSDYDNPANAAQPYLDKIPGYADQAFNPYIERGATAGDINSQQYALMASNPSGYYDSLYAGYDQSPTYNYQSDQMQKAYDNSASAGGYSGTEYDYQQQMAGQNSLQQEDWERYLQDVLGIQGTGLQGNQQMYNTGFKASNGWADMMNGYANASAGNQAMGVQNQNMMKNSQMNQLLQSAGLVGGLAML